MRWEPSLLTPVDPWHLGPPDGMLLGGTRRTLGIAKFAWGGGVQELRNTASEKAKNLSKCMFSGVGILPETSPNTEVF